MNRYGLTLEDFGTCLHNSLVPALNVCMNVWHLCCNKEESSRSTLDLWVICSFTVRTWFIFEKECVINLFLCTSMHLGGVCIIARTFVKACIHPSLHLIRRCGQGVTRGMSTGGVHAQHSSYPKQETSTGMHFCFFIQFSAKSFQIISFTPNLEDASPLTEKSWIGHWLISFSDRDAMRYLVHSTL